MASPLAAASCPLQLRSTNLVWAQVRVQQVQSFRGPWEPLERTQYAGPVGLAVAPALQCQCPEGPEGTSSCAHVAQLTLLCILYTRGPALLLCTCSPAHSLLCTHGLALFLCTCILPPVHTWPSTLPFTTESTTVVSAVVILAILGLGGEGMMPGLGFSLLPVTWSLTFQAQSLSSSLGLSLLHSPPKWPACVSGLGVKN